MSACVRASTDPATPQNLGFLYPLRRIQMELSAELKQDASAVAVYKWIKACADT